MEKSNTNYDFKVHTICMQPPKTHSEKTIERQPKIKDSEFDNLIKHEAFLRREAYKNTTIQVTDSFFDDSDMKNEYYLVVVYDKTSNTPLLSSRHYFDKSIISKFLKGENNNVIDPEVFDMDKYEDGKIFLADRLSGNLSNEIYKKNRKDIFSLYYSEIVRENKDCTLLLMVRKEKEDQQLAKYLYLGFTIIGSAIHKGKEHHIIIRDLFK